MPKLPEWALTLPRIFGTPLFTGGDGGEPNLVKTFFALLAGTLLAAVLTAAILLIVWFSWKVHR